MVYLPLANYMTPEAARIIEDYVRAGGVLVCGDAEAFSFDLAGNDTSATRERILGIQTLGPKTQGVNREGAKTRSSPESPDRIILKSARWGLPEGASLRLFDLKLGDEVSPGRARQIALSDAKAEVLGTYPDGSPAIITHQLGKGRVITFAANPFVPQATVDASAWPTAFKGLQRALGCKVDQSIWHLVLPAPD
jgi:hypothetical protein